MIDHVWTVVCSRAVIDQDTNNISIQNVIEQLNIFAEPKPDGVIPSRLEVVTLWIRADPNTPCRGQMRLTFRSPSNRVIGTFDRPIDLSEHERLRSRIRFEGVAAEESGRHHFYVELQNEGESEWRQVAAVPLAIIFEPPEDVQTERQPEQQEG